ncbi:hypothetical protein Ancab_001597, partial [Ancistrocladus abbreviatus]
MARDIKSPAKDGINRDAQVQKEAGRMSTADVNSQPQGTTISKSYKEALLHSGSCEETKKLMPELVFEVRDDESAWLKGSVDISFVRVLLVLLLFVCLPLLVLTSSNAGSDFFSEPHHSLVASPKLSNVFFKSLPYCAELLYWCVSRY